MATAMSNFARLLEDTVQVNEAERLFRKAITVGESAWAGPFGYPAVCKPLRAPTGEN
jgi:hypothetical protein